MSKRSKKNKGIEEVFIYSAILAILILTAANINKFLSVKPVLGTSTISLDSESLSFKERVFWENFVENNPNYIPAWIQLGRMDKVREIDPNYYIK